MSRRATRSIYLDWLAQVMRPVDATVYPTGSADLVLGYATGYGVAEVGAFVRSLRAVYDGPVALFVSDAPDLRAFLAQHDIEALTTLGSNGWAPLPVVARFADYAALLASRPQVRDVLLTDVRDVVFQASPFEPRPRALEVFVEDEPHRLADHAFQTKYLRLLVGEGLTGAVSDRPSICAGVIAGERGEVERLCRLIVTLGAIPRSSVGGGFGVDQASLNVAVHLGLIEAEVVSNFGRVATVGLDLEGATVEGGRIVNGDGSISPIVHQYDRHPEMMEGVRSKWEQGTPDRVAPAAKGLARRLRRLGSSLSMRWPEAR